MSDLCPDHAGYVVQDLGREIEGPSISHGRIVPRPLIGMCATEAASHRRVSVGP